MLRRFSVENFKGFEDKLVFDMGSPSNYSFNSDIIENGCVTKGIVYGINSCGKSNLGLAIFDIITHLTEKERLLRNYDLYLNMSGRKSFAEFEYIFDFDGHEVIYRYKKNNVDILREESLSIDNREVIYYDYIKNEGFTRLEGSATLNATIKNESPISRVKYVNNNSILDDNIENKIFKKFVDFVEHMLLFYSLDSRGYEGFTNGSKNVTEGIVNSGKVDEFQEFLKQNGIIYSLYGCEVDGRKRIYCHFENQDVDFFKIASTGTRSLALFFYWYIQMQNASFVFVDEFDAFYHFELSENVQKMLRAIKHVQIFTTTHNTDLMSNDLLRPDCYYILKDNKIKTISELTQKELRFAHNLQKMYKAGAFDE
ncbi:ATP-binding protein [Eubacterium sp. MSJ-13]|uniref:AAA family ATPase n=1 Tax=Eubacterium sp. MSJ-13 TaxID=2841513 RepID=UPI001C0F65A3|nr:AAA family ATPase [Eubacterium sp. MSJ-13]MBU5479014.1 ATP-binding protein [Eubacterium sp. MSJ-13]